MLEATDSATVAFLRTENQQLPPGIRDPFRGGHGTVASCPHDGCGVVSSSSPGNLDFYSGLGSGPPSDVESKEIIVEERAH